MTGFITATPRSQESISLVKGVYDLFFNVAHIPLTEDQKHHAKIWYQVQMRGYRKTLNLFVLALPVALIAMLILNAGSLSDGDSLVAPVVFWSFRLLFFGFAAVLFFNYVVCPIIVQLRVPKILNSFDFYTPNRAFCTYPIPDALLNKLVQSQLDHNKGLDSIIKKRIYQHLVMKGWINTQDLFILVQDAHILYNLSASRGVHIDDPSTVSFFDADGKTTFSEQTQT